MKWTEIIKKKIMSGTTIQQVGSIASSLMLAGARTCEITGLGLSVISTLYLMHYMTGTGCSLIEYIPHLFANTDKKFKDHMAEKNRLTLRALGITALLLISGVILRKGGTLLSSPSVISGMENFLYNQN